MRRLLLTSNALSGGGTERVAYTHGKIFARLADFEVAVLTCERRAGYPPEMGIKQYILPDFRQVSKIRGVLDHNFNKKAMAEILEDFAPDVIHIHAYVNFGIGAARALAEYKSKSGCRVIMTHHGYAHFCPNDYFFNYRTNQLCEKCMKNNKNSGNHGFRLLLDNCASNPAVSAGKYLQKRGFRKIFSERLADVHVTPCEFSREKFSRCEPEFDVRLIRNPCLETVSDKMPDKISGKMVYFGRISREKNVAAAAEAVLRLKSSRVRLTIIGSGPDEHELNKILSGQSNSEISFINEFMPKARLHRAVSDAEYFILPSVWYEVAPVSMIEAINLGMTPIVSNHGGMKEIAERAGIGYMFDPKDIGSIAAAIEQAAANRKADEKKLEGGVARDFLKMHTEQTYEEKLIDIYSSF